MRQQQTSHRKPVSFFLEQFAHQHPVENPIEVTIEELTNDGSKASCQDDLATALLAGDCGFLSSHPLAVRCGLQWPTKREAAGGRACSLQIGGPGSASAETSGMAGFRAAPKWVTGLPFSASPLCEVRAVLRRRGAASCPLRSPVRMQRQCAQKTPRDSLQAPYADPHPMPATPGRHAEPPHESQMACGPLG